MLKSCAAKMALWRIIFIFFLAYFCGPEDVINIRPVECSLTMKRLYEDLFTDYNRLILPVAHNKTKVTVNLGLKLGQLLDLNLKQQILSTNVWVEQTWQDHRLEWDAQLYDGIDMIHVPAENIWIPDIVLFNNADGNYELTLVAKAVLYANGTVVWKPPTMFRSTCEIDVEYFPFDIQTCYMRFGSWTYAGDEVEIKHIGNKRKVDIGIDLSQFYKNVEWDIIDVPAYYNEVYYDCCKEPFPDVIFKIVIRRKMLFYLVNLILPVALMTFMTVSVFYLPSDSYEKVTLSISILTSLIVFFLLMLEIIPPTSLAVPLFGKYLLFTLVLVSLSACVSVYVLNIHHRSPSVHSMSPRTRQLFLKTLPRLLRLDRPDQRERSSLNRFRKKKLAQQLLDAHQQQLHHSQQHHGQHHNLYHQSNKVYDLAQPLAASLNLIETLHKSYNFNPKDDKAAGTRNKQAGGDEENLDDEGRYFRRYVDDYISQLKEERRKRCQLHANNTTNSAIDPNGRCTCNTTTTTTTNISNNQRSTGTDCCSCATKINRCYYNTDQWNRGSGACQQRQQQQGTMAARNKMLLASCCSGATTTNLDWTTPETSGAGGGGGSAGGGGDPLMHPLLSSSGRQYASATTTMGYATGTTARRQSHFGAINDDTLDMTFDYDDQQDTNQAIHNQHQAQRQPLVAAAADDELPSPPPPPRQLTQLSDSLRDMSGRLSSCSQQKLTAGRDLMGRGHLISDEDENDRSADAQGQLVGRLVGSINIFNDASDDIDSTTTTTSNNDIHPNDCGDDENDSYRHHLKVMAQQLGGPVRQGTSVSPLAYNGKSIDDQRHQKQTTVFPKQQVLGEPSQCSCNPPISPSFQDSLAKVTSSSYHEPMAQQRRQHQVFHHQQSRSAAPRNANDEFTQHQSAQNSYNSNNNGPNRQPSELLLSLRLPYDKMPPHVRAAIRSILFIADTIKNEDDENSAIEDWESMSMVVDRLFLWIFFILCTFGSFIILALAPSLYDQRDSIDDKLRIEIPPSNCSALVRASDHL